VYSTLAMALICCCIGAVFDMRFHIGGLMTTLATVGLTIYVGMDQNKSSRADVQRRLLTLGAIGFLQGTSIGPLIATAIYINPSLLISAFLSTSMIFVAFTIAALRCSRSHILYMAGIAGSIMTVTLALALVSLFTRSPMLFSIELYLGVVVLSLYVVIDTSLIFDKFERGSRDVVGHSLSLFVDFIGLFIRILIILMQNSERKDRKRRNGRD